MTREETRFSTALLGYRKSEVNNCVEHLYAVNAQEQSLARQQLRVTEERIALVEQENSALRQELAKQSAAQTIAAASAQGAESQVEALNRKLAAAQSEIRKYQTRLFACERETLALRRENAELEALCEKARENGITLDEQERAAVSAFVQEPEEYGDIGPDLLVAERTDEPHLRVAAPARPAPRTELEALSYQLLDQMQQIIEREDLPIAR